MFTLDDKSKGKLLLLGALCAPAIAVQGVRMFASSSGPTGALAAPPSAPAVLAQPAPAAQSLTANQQKALAWLRSRDQELTLRSPMDRPDPFVSNPAPVTLAPVAKPVPHATTDNRPANLALTGMIAQGPNSRGLVSINHRVFRTGESVAPGWVVDTIDTRERFVLIKGPDNATIRLEPAQPSATRE